MAEPLAAVFRRPFAEQVAALRLRLGNQVPTARWDELWQAAQDRGFTVAGALKADLLADLAAAVRKGVEDGRSLEEFRADFRATVERHGWPGTAGAGSRGGFAWRTRVIYRTNAATSYAAGRWAQIRASGLPFLVYRHGGSREPRPLHLAWDGLVLPAEHEFWATHAPPNGWGCSCYVVGARTRAGARRVGGEPGKELAPGWQARDPRTGAPRGIDRGWAYAPGASVADAIRPLRAKLPGLPPEIARALLQDLLPRLPAAEGAELAHALPERAVEQQDADFRIFADRAIGGLPQGKRFLIGALRQEWIDAARAAGREPASADMWVEDNGLRHALRPGKHRPVEASWLRELPAHMRQPDAVLLDPNPLRPAFLFVFRDRQGDIKIAFRIDFRRGDFGPANLLRTAQIVDLSGLRGALAGGMLVKIAGDL